MPNTDLTKTNLELLNEEAVKLGYDKAPFTDEGEALYWIALAKLGMQENTHVSISGQVATNRTDINTLLKRGSFLGTYIKFDAISKIPKEGDYVLIGSRDMVMLYIYNGANWVNPKSKNITVGDSSMLPIGLSEINKGQAFFETDSKTFYVWDGKVWLKERKTVVVDGFTLRLY